MSPLVLDVQPLSAVRIAADLTPFRSSSAMNGRKETRICRVAGVEGGQSPPPGILQLVMWLHPPAINDDTGACCQVRLSRAH